MHILEVNVDDIGRGGVFSLIKEVALHSSDFVIDIAAYEPFQEQQNRLFFENRGGKIYDIGNAKNKINKILGCIKRLERIIVQNNYDAVHIHSDVAYKLLLMGIGAKMGRAKKIILHSHASNVDGNKRWLKSLLHNLCRRVLKYIATDFVSCSFLAAQWMFPNVKRNEIIIINNGVDIHKFQFSPQIREDIRKQLGLTENQILVGNIGRFAYQKNHKYLLRIFVDLLKKEPKSRLILIGEGELQNDIEEQAKRLNISEYVIFYGVSDNVSELLQAIDVFVLPSHFEGLPIVGVEAQTAGLPVVFSNEITTEAKITDNVSYLPINNESVSMWSDEIIRYSKLPRLDTSEIVRKSGFCIETTIGQFVSLYLNN